MGAGSHYSLYLSFGFISTTTVDHHKVVVHRADMVDKTLLKAQAADPSVAKVSMSLSATHYDSQMMY